MVEFAYNNTKNINTSYMLFEFNYKYHLYILFKENTDLWSKSLLADKLLSEV